MRASKILFLAPAALALAGCMSYGGPTAYSTPYYSYPSYTYSSPGTYVYPGTSYYSYPSGSYYIGPGTSVSRFDRDGDGVSNNLDRYPYDARRW